jgi:hypothetical protein
MKCKAPLQVPMEGYIRRFIEVPCGKCLNCLESKRAIWTFRIMNELEVAESARFVTLTYDEKYLPWINENKQIGTLWEEDTPLKKSENIMESLNLADLQKFIKDVRNEILKESTETLKRRLNSKDRKEAVRWIKRSEKTGKWSPKLRYFACGEYGEKGNRPHYHIILYNLPNHWYKYDSIHKEEYSPRLEKIWGKGIISIGNVERGSAHYVAKYTIKQLLDNWDENDIRIGPFAVMSKNPGIGSNYINDDNRNYFINTENYHTRLKGGYIQPIGRYYKEKIWEPKKEKSEFEIQTESGRTEIKTGGIRLYTKEESNAKRKTHEYTNKKEKIEKDQILGEIYGDIVEAELIYIKRKREEIATDELRAKSTNLKGKKL